MARQQEQETDLSYFHPRAESKEREQGVGQTYS